MQLRFAAAAGDIAALDRPELLELPEGGLHALRGDARAASELAVGEPGLVGEMPEGRQVPQRQSVVAQVRFDLLADQPAETDQKKGGAGRLGGLAGGPGRLTRLLGDKHARMVLAVESEQMTGTSKAGRLPSSKVTGVRTG